MRREWGQRVAIGRRALRMTQDRLARLCGVTQQAISHIERGVVSPSDEVKCRIAGVLHQRVEMLFPLEPVQPSEAA